MKDRPQGAGYQPPNELLIPLDFGRGFYHSAKVLSIQSSLLSTQHSVLSMVNAATNIRDEGMRLLVLGTSATASGESVRPKRGRKTSVEVTVYEVGSPHYSVSHSDGVQRYIARCRGTACRAPMSVPHVNENRYILLLAISVG
ncbi:MAG: hypothetical protein V7L26_25155 [Nostoc sp.]